MAKRLKKKNEEIDEESYKFIDDLKRLAANLPTISIVFPIGDIQVTFKKGHCEVFVNDTKYGDCTIGRKLHFCKRIPLIKTTIRTKLVGVLNTSLTDD